MADLISLETNREARRKVRQWNDDNPENQREWNEVDSTEIKAFIGLCLYAGLHKSRSGVLVMGGHCSPQPCLGIDLQAFSSSYGLIIVQLDKKGKLMRNLHHLETCGVYSKCNFQSATFLVQIFALISSLWHLEADVVFDSTFHLSQRNMELKFGGAVIHRPVTH